VRVGTLVNENKTIIKKKTADTLRVLGGSAARGNAGEAREPGSVFRLGNPVLAD